MRERKYTVGSVINNKWVIISILEVRKQNKKLICYNLSTNQFKEGWIWDFTRDIVTDIPNRKMYCKAFEKLESVSEYAIDELLNIHLELSNSCYYKHEFFTRDEYYLLQCVREGYLLNVKSLLKKFDWLLYKAEKDNQEKAEFATARLSKKLAKTIQLTYIILNKRGFFNN